MAGSAVEAMEAGTVAADLAVEGLAVAGSVAGLAVGG